MKTTIARCIFLVLLLAVTSAAWADYVNPPDFTPQRTLFWEFSQSATENPVSVAGGTWDEGQWECDFLETSGSLQWYPSSGRWAGRTGLIGYDNSNGESSASGSWKIHINNFPLPNPVKLIWFEVEVCQWGTVDSTPSFNVPEGCVVQKVGTPFEEQLAPGVFRINEKWEIRPNPGWEEFLWSFTVSAGSGILVDKFYISTACVPEPSSLIALGTGLMGLGGLIMRKRRT